MLKKQKEKVMEDKSTGYLTQSERYYCRREPKSDDFTKIVYYDLKGKHIPLAKATCEHCSDKIESQMCGDFVSCKCGKTSVDTDRWMPEQHRYLTTPDEDNS